MTASKLQRENQSLCAPLLGTQLHMAQLRELYLTGNRLRNRALGPRAWTDLSGLQVRGQGRAHIRYYWSGCPEPTHLLGPGEGGAEGQGL